MFRTDEDLRRSFDRTARILDAGLERAKEKLAPLPIEIRDSCNRSGIDHWAGVPYYVWSFEILHDTDQEGRIRRAGVALHYMEPMEAEDPPADLAVRASAEVFRRGEFSDATAGNEWKVPLADVSDPEAFAIMVGEALERAMAELARLR